MKNEPFLDEIGVHDSKSDVSRYFSTLERSIISEHKQYFKTNSIDPDHEGSAMYAAVVHYYSNAL